jgi:uncharacterized protein (TIGR02598 family)
MKSTACPSNGFSLVEVTLALGVAAISMIAIFGLLATGMQTNQLSTQQTGSSDILGAVAADLHATLRTIPPGGATTSTQFAIGIPANGSSATSTLYFDAVGQYSTSLNESSTYRLTITFLSNGGGRTATFADLKMTWPAAADPASATTAKAETFLALDRN